MTVWVLIVTMWAYSNDDGFWHRHVGIKDAVYETKAECEAVLYRREHGDTMSSDQNQCVEISVKRMP